MLAAAAAYPEDVFLLRSEAVRQGRSMTIHFLSIPFAFSPSMPFRTFFQGDDGIDGCMIFLDESVYMSYTYDNMRNLCARCWKMSIIVVWAWVFAFPVRIPGMLPTWRSNAVWAPRWGSKEESEYYMGKTWKANENPTI